MANEWPSLVNKPIGSPAMSTADRTTSAPAVIDLHFEDRDGRVKVVPPNRDIMVIPVEEAIAACRAFKDQIEFGDQFKLLLERLGDWILERKPFLREAFVVVRDQGLLFLVVMDGVSFDSPFEDELTDLDIEIANNDDYRLIRLDVLALPKCSGDSVNSFLASGKTFKYRLNG